MGTDVNKFQFRLVLLGSNGTGKTSILNRFLFKKFETKYKPTVEDLFSKDFDLGAIEIKVDFLDTSGSMQFPAMRRLSITTGNAFLIVYAVDDASSFEVLKMSVAEIQEARPDDYQEVPIVFAGNKSDTPKEQRKVSKEQVSNYVYYELPRLRTKVIECSCKDNINVDAIFKAYLSLAKVRLATAVAAANSASPLPSSAPNFSYASAGAKKRMSAHALNSSEQNHGPTSGGINSESANAASSQKPSNSSSNNSTSTNKQRSSSIKLALGVRKSCDASIISSMRKVSLSGGSSKSPREQSGSISKAREQGEQQQQTTTEVVLSDAMLAKCKDGSSRATGYGFGRSGSHSSSANRLAVDQGALKPRSRSLIWRPSRKSSRSSANDASECRVT